MMNAGDAHIVNTSSVNGFWASIGPGRPHTAYSAAKFAVKGFSEALITDLAMNAPHVKVSVVMPGHIGTEIAHNSRKILTGSENEVDIAASRKMIAAWGIDTSSLTDQQVRDAVIAQAEAFRDNAPTTAAQAAKIIIDGVRADKWRILVGPDAEYLDGKVRANPEAAYTPEFYQELLSQTGWRL
jgi:short-subunit dehydrogenase